MKVLVFIYLVKTGSTTPTEKGTVVSSPTRNTTSCEESVRPAPVTSYQILNLPLIESDE